MKDTLVINCNNKYKKMGSSSFFSLGTVSGEATVGLKSILQRCFEVTALTDRTRNWSMITSVKLLSPSSSR